MRLLRRSKIATSQPSVLEGYTSNPELTEVVKRLPGYLQPVVTLMATMVPPTDERKMREKKGWEAMNQAASMVLMVRAFFRLYLP